MKRSREERLLDEHLAWLNGREPSQAVRDFERDADESPLGRFADARCRAIAKRRAASRLAAKLKGAAR